MSTSALISKESLRISADLLAEYAHKKPELDRVLFSNFDAASAAELSCVLEKISCDPLAENKLDTQTWDNLSSLFRTIASYAAPFRETFEKHGNDNVYHAIDEVADYAYSHHDQLNMRH